MNLMLDTNCNIKLIDFGDAKTLYNEDEEKDELFSGLTIKNKDDE